MPLLGAISEFAKRLTGLPLAAGARHGNLSYGFVTRGLKAAFAQGCRRLQVKLQGKLTYSPLLKSCGARVRSADGFVSWLKVSGVPCGHPNERREREAAAWGIARAPMPTLIESVDWTANNVEWRALRTTLAPSPTLLQYMQAGGVSLAHDDRWIAALRDALEGVAATPTAFPRRTSEYVAGSILDRFGPDAPGVASEWRTAHADLSWSNVTVPELTLLDWETWGLMPRGYDAAYLIVHSLDDPLLMRRLESAFEEDLSTESGRIARLLACAEVLNRMKLESPAAASARLVEDIARRALDGL